MRLLLVISVVILAEFVTVGWGKKETQFHGSEGKQAAAAKPEVRTAIHVVTMKPLKDHYCEKPIEGTCFHG